MKAAFCIGCLAALPALAEGPSAREAFRPVLEKAGLAPGDLRLDRSEVALFGGDRHRLALWDLFADDPLRIPAYADRFRDALLDGEASLHTPLAWAFARTGAGVRRNLAGDPNAEEAAAAAKPDALFEAIAAVHAAAGKPLAAGELDGLRKRCGEVPGDLARPMALLLRVAVRSAAFRELALGKLPAAERSRLFDAAPRLLSIRRKAEPDEARFVQEAIGRVDAKYLAAGAADLALALEAAVKDLRAYGGSRAVSFAAATPWGEVRLQGERPEAPSDRILLLVDLAGDDAHGPGAGATRDALQPASLAIDLAGNDVYACAAEDRPSSGCGVLGYGFVVDAAGNDRYEAVEMSQGAGVFGAGGLWDLAGDDAYKVRSHGQGAAFAGAGVLADDAGSDAYLCTAASQGFGYVAGCGVLLDRSGSDAYTADDMEIVHPSAQTKDHNTSLAQGCGLGERADLTDGHSLAGGVGALVDGGGDDVYRCGVFGQGCGYWYGIGMLLDRDGNDAYEGVWYAQGASAHFAIGVLADGGGNDAYRASMNQSQGMGHDLSVGFLVDRAGNDRYEAPNLCLGAGNDNGIGLFWDLAGDDAYEAKNRALGYAEIHAPKTVRGEIRCVGLFLDGGGKDRYPFPCARDGASWTLRDAREPAPSEKGAGADVPDGGR